MSYTDWLALIKCVSSSFIAHHDNPNCKLLQDYYKLRQKFLTNYGRFYYKLSQWVITNCGKYLVQITTKNYCKLRQLLFLQNSKLLQFTASFITNYIAVFSFITNYGKFITNSPSITNYHVITNCAVTEFNKSSCQNLWYCCFTKIKRLDIFSKIWLQFQKTFFWSDNHGSLLS